MSQSVNAYPDGALYWYGNKAANFVYSNKPVSQYVSGVYQGAFTEQTNSFTFVSGANGRNFYSSTYYIDKKVDTSEYTKYKVKVKNAYISNTSDYNEVAVMFSPLSGTYVNSGSSTYVQIVASPNGERSYSGIKEIDISSYSTEAYFVINIAGPTLTIDEVEAIWLE